MSRGNDDAHLAGRMLECRYRLLIENLHEGVTIVDTAENVTFANPAAERIFGVEPGTLVGRNLREFLDDGLWQELLEQTKLSRQEEAIFHELSFNRPDGELRILSVSVTPEYDSEGVFTGSFGLINDITERKLAEEVLRYSEEKFQGVFEHTNSGVAILEAVDDRNDYVFIDINTRAEEIEKVNRAEVIGRRMTEVFPGVEQFGLLEVMRRVQQTGKPENHPIAMYQDERIQGWRENYVFRLSSGEIVAIYDDITERMQAEDALKQSEERFRDLVETTSDWIWASDNEGICTYASPQVEDILGYKQEEVTGKSPFDLMPTAEVKRVSQIFKEWQKNNEPVFSVEYTCFHKDGQRIELETRGVKILDAENNLIGYRGMNRDITERKRAKVALEQQMEIQTTLIEALPYPAMLIRKDRTVIFTNKVAKEVGAQVGGLCWRDYGQSEFIAEDDKEYINEHKCVPPGGTHCIFCQADEALEHSQPKVAPQIEAFGRIWEINWVPVGEDVYLHYALDVTDRLRIEEEALSLERKILQAQKLESLGVLAGGIAHDFNNLLFAVLGNADLALMQLAPHAPARGRIVEVVKAAQRAAELSRQMLAYSGQGKFSVATIRLNESIAEMANLLEASISKKATLKYDFAADLPLFEGDVTQINQVVMNLIVNASEALEQASGVISVTTGVVDCTRKYLDATSTAIHAAMDELLPEGRYVYFEVADNGCGMDDKTLEKIFDPFFTTKFIGRGLGLAATLGIIRGHYGAINVYSEVGQGTVFKVLFPATDAEMAAARLSLAEQQDEIWQGTGTILVADDEEPAIAVAVQMLELMGFTVLTAADGREAVEVFRGHQDEVVAVLLDLTMPNLNGEEAFEEIRAIRSDAKVLLCSGYNEQEVTQRFTGRGLAGFIHKPYTTQMLMTMIQQILED